MASVRLHVLLLFIQAFILFSHSVKSDDEDKQLLQRINSYRASLNLPALSKNDNAECLAQEIADQLEDQLCTKAIGANTIPGSETQVSNYPKAMSHCHITPTNARDGVVMPACIPDLPPSLVASNFTGSQYSHYLNDTKFTGIGIGSDGNWIVVVLTTNTHSGSFATSTSASSIPMLCLTCLLLSLFLGFFLIVSS